MNFSSFSVATSPEASAALPIAHKLKRQDMATNGLQCYIPHQIKRKNKQTDWSKGRNGVGPAHAMCLHLDQSIICWQGAVFYSTYMAVPMGKPEDGEGGYFIEERGLVTRKEFCDIWNNWCPLQQYMKNSYYYTQPRIYIHMYEFTVNM